MKMEKILWYMDWINAKHNLKLWVFNKRSNLRGYNLPKYAVIGAGNGGQAMAAVLKNKGNQVSLWTSNLQKIKEIVLN